MPGHERIPIPVVVDLTETIDRTGPVVREVTLVNSVVALVNLALREYDLEIVPSIDFKKEKP